MDNINWVEINVLKDWIDFKESVVSCPFEVEAWDMLQQFYENLPDIGRNYIDNIFNGQTFYMDPNEVLDYINYLAETNIYSPDYAQETQPTHLAQPYGSGLSDELIAEIRECCDDSRSTREEVRQTLANTEIDKTFEKMFKHLNDIKLALQLEEVEQVPIDHPPDNNYLDINNFHNSPLQDYQHEVEINSPIEDNYNYNLLENLYFNGNTLDESLPIDVGPKMSRHINELGHEVLRFYWDVSSESSDDSMEDLEFNEEAPLEHNFLFPSLPEEEPCMPPPPPLETIDITTPPSNSHNYNYSFEENLKFYENIYNESLPLAGEPKMDRHINELGDEILQFYWDDISSESSDDSMDDLDYSEEGAPFEHNFLLSSLPEDETCMPPPPHFETIDVLPRHVPFNPTTHPIIDTELSREYNYLKQAELDRLWLEKENLELDELERLIFNPEKSDSEIEDIIKLDQNINDLPVLSNLINSSHNDESGTEPKNMLNNKFGGDLKIIDSIFSKNVDKSLEDLCHGDVFDFIIPIYRPKVDPMLNYHANQFSPYSNKLIYPKTKKKKYWLGKFPFWRKFGSVEFMPVHTTVYAARECHPSLIEFVKL